eukprot:CAMPEP_0196818150 /NCGR_PEP_ID=MMETSP1362-20130617/64229_1 /TAXON_ID=163516 /ORGANISM="Leptocylindrus danicus, Strain CCMP1856" /LENGTH=399 /DNA_ID=CAMNT_0042196119 /DNA_START=155 /DNA_END=1354 /DNA_ORIENTATION=-
MICFDGTGNDVYGQLPDYEGADQTFSNVLKLHILGGGAIDPEVEDQAFEASGQISIYQRGLAGKDGMEGDPFTAIPEAIGILRLQIDPLKEKLATVYEKGDQLYVFGFSRGAASARLFASQLAEDGLEVNGEVIDDSPEIALLGCFDTVAMQVGTGIVLDSKKQRYPSCRALGEDDFKVSPIVNKAVHLVSLDDFRQWKFPNFPPTLMGMEERVDEVWFPGVHSDVGGFWSKKNGLADTSLNYMIKACEAAGLQFLAPEDVDTKAVTIPLDDEVWVMQEDKQPLACNPETDNEKGGYNHANDESKRVYSPRPIYVAKRDRVFELGKPKIHVSAYDHVLSYKPTEDVAINPYFEELDDFVIVGDDGQVMPLKTAAMKDFIANYDFQPLWDKVWNPVEETV